MKRKKKDINLPMYAGIMEFYEKLESEILVDPTYLFILIIMLAILSIIFNNLL